MTVPSTCLRTRLSLLGFSRQVSGEPVGLGRCSPALVGGWSECESPALAQPRRCSDTGCGFLSSLCCLVAYSNRIQTTWTCVCIQKKLGMGPKVGVWGWPVSGRAAVSTGRLLVSFPSFFLSTTAGVFTCTITSVGSWRNSLCFPVSWAD